jgi:hypothetical protein
VNGKLAFFTVVEPMLLVSFFFAN